MPGRVPTVFNVTPKATNITTTKPDEIRCPALVETFTLDSVKGFHNRIGRTNNQLGVYHYSKFGETRQESVDLTIVKASQESVFH